MIVELMVKNGVTTKFSENLFKNLVNDEPIIELDFSEHDKVFEDKIASLEKELSSVVKEAERQEFIREMSCLERQELKERIAELESKETETCEKETKVSASSPSMEWYENRHQSDCIEINRLNTTIDVLIHKVEYLRQFAGLE
jgi:hypothetical protein